MRHLSRDVLLALAERSTVDAESHRHAAECRRCRDEVLSLVRVLREVRAVDVPEPSPLFWDHLSARVRSALDSEAAPHAARHRIAWPWWAAAVSVLCAVGVLVISIAPLRRSMVARPVSDAQVARVASPGVVSAWDEVVDAAATEPAEEPMDLVLTPASAERAMLELSPEEDLELARLLRQELGQPAL